MRSKDVSRSMIHHYLTMLGLGGIEPGGESITAKVRAAFMDRGFDDIEHDAEGLGLTVSEYAHAVDRLVTGLGEDVIAVSNQLDYWTIAAGLAMDEEQ